MTDQFWDGTGNGAQFVKVPKKDPSADWPWRLHLGPSSWLVLETAPAWPYRLMARLLGFRWERRDG